jgi:hypothetical protein
LSLSARLAARALPTATPSTTPPYASPSRPSAPATSTSRPVLLLRKGIPTQSLLFRSHRQQPATTCNLSVVGPHRRVRVRGCPWSSVAVDVPIDVGRGAPRSLASTGWCAVAEHLIPREVFHDQASQRGCGIADLARYGSCGIPSAWRSPTTRRPRGGPRRNRCVPRVALPLGRRVVALGGGRWDATPCPPRPAAGFLCPAIPEVCPPGEGMV